MELTHDYQQLLRGARLLMGDILIDVTRDYLKHLKALYKRYPEKRRKRLSPEELVAISKVKGGDIGYHGRMAQSLYEYLWDHRNYYGEQLIKTAHKKVRIWLETGEDQPIGKRRFRESRYKSTGKEK